MKVRLFLMSLFFCMFSISLTAQWTQIGDYIYGELGDLSGYSLALSKDGNTFATGGIGIGSSGNGYVQVYSWNESEWLPKGNPITGNSGGFTGIAVAISGNGSRLVVGAPNDSTVGNKNGLTRVYEWNGTDWVQIGSDIFGISPLDRSGRVIGITSDGNRIAVASSRFKRTTYPRYTQGGHVRIFDWDGTQWIQSSPDIEGNGTYQNLGTSLAFSEDGKVIAIGCNSSDISQGASDKIRIFRQPGTTSWTQIGIIYSNVSNDGTGSTVSLSADGNTVAFSTSYSANGVTNLGQVKVYQKNGYNWTQLGQNLTGTYYNDTFGSSISLANDGLVLAVGMPRSSTIDPLRGKARMFEYDGTSWEQSYQTLNGLDREEEFGSVVSISGDGHKVAISAPYGGLYKGFVGVFTNEDILGVSDIEIIDNVSLYPNPTKNKFTIEFKEGLLLEKITIYNSLGQFVTTTQDKTVTTSELSSGLYYVEIITNKGKVTKKLVIE